MLRIFKPYRPAFIDGGKIHEVYFTSVESLLNSQVCTNWILNPEFDCFKVTSNHLNGEMLYTLNATMKDGTSWVVGFTYYPIEIEEK